MSMYRDIRWIVQRNLSGEDVIDRMEASFQALDIDYVLIDMIPFSDSLPSFPKDKACIFYGSTTMNHLAGQDESLKNGLFFDPQIFSIENYLRQWGSHMLNYEATVATINDFLQEEQEDMEKLLFIRPDDDQKAFAGEVRKAGEVREWLHGLIESGITMLSPESKIVIGAAYNIRFEWRLWIVERKVIAASRYRESFRLSKTPGCPPEVVAFAEERCREYVPDAVFVMDIGLCGDTYYIIECNCMNGAGFYAADIHNIIQQVSSYRQRQVSLP